MLTQEEMMAYFRNMPKKEKKNPYWQFDEATEQIVAVGEPSKPVLLEHSRNLFLAVQSYFRMVFESFQTEAQVLCIHEDDTYFLAANRVPQIPGRFFLNGIPISIFVLPQNNTMGNSVISETFWQKYIVGNDITPVARIHSHHVLDAYQSATDYSTLNSNTLEIVMGHINEPYLQIAFWLDEHGKDTKSYVFQQTEQKQGRFTTVRIAPGLSKLI